MKKWRSQHIVKSIINVGSNYTPVVRSVVRVKVVIKIKTTSVTGKNLEKHNTKQNDNNS